MKDKNFKIGKYFKRHKFGCSLYVFMTILNAIPYIFTTIILANAIEDITLQRYKEAIIKFVIVLVIDIVMKASEYLTKLIYFKYTTKIMADINCDLADQAFKLSSSTFSQYSTGTFVQRIVSEPQAVVGELANLIATFTMLMSAFIILIYIMTLNFYISLIMILAVGISAILEYYRLRVLGKNKKELRKKSDELHSLTNEIVKSEKDVKSLALDTKLSKISNGKFESYTKTQVKTSCQNVTFHYIRSAFLAIIGSVVLILGVYFMESSLLTIAAFMVIYSNRSSVNNMVYSAGSIGSLLTEIKISIGRMAGLFDSNKFKCESFGDKHLQNIRGAITFKNVAYGYEDKVPEDDGMLANKRKMKKEVAKVEEPLKINKYVFENLSFEIKENTTVAFVGRSGSGKTTILSLMAKMFEASSGEVLIDGVNINELDKDTLRGGKIALVNQFPYIFDMSVKENLFLANSDATEEEMLDALEKAFLKDFVLELKDGINTNVGESGVKLSGGQRQRLAIARAILKKPAILLFDESTSSLDNFAQEHIKKSIDAIKGACTIVIVAHRLSTIKSVDKIFFLEDGVIIADGTFDELFNGNDKFKAMFMAENI